MTVVVGPASEHDDMVASNGSSSFRRRQAFVEVEAQSGIWSGACSSLSGLKSEDPKVSSFFDLRMSAPLCGREAETEILQSEYNNVVGFHKSRCLIIKAGSGTGKSALCNSIVDHVVARDGFFVTGKFDQLETGVPYSALVKVFQDLCDLIRGSQNVDFFRIRIADALGPGKEALEQLSILVPNLYQVMGVDYCQTPFAFGRRALLQHQEAFIKFKLLCRTFLRAVATERHPLVIFFDDLQFADEGSLEVILSLLSDRESKSVLYLGAHRDEELEGSSEAFHMFQRFCAEPGAGNQESIPIRTICIRNLNLEQVNFVVSEAIRRPLTEITQLGQVVFSKTQGLPLGVIEYLHLLISKSLLWKSAEEQAWEWNLERIQHETNISPNVVAILAERIQELDKTMISSLSIAAALGHRFDAQVLGILLADEWRRLASGDLSDEIAKERLETMLVDAISQGLVEKCGCNQYKFSHDKIQKVLYDTTKSGTDRSMLHLRIGRRIYKLSKEAGRASQDAFVFVAADQLNQGSGFLELEEKLSLIRLNHDAGVRAVSKSAPANAVKYLRSAVSLLDGQNMWESNHDLCLDVYSTCAELESQCGNFENSMKAAGTVLNNASSFHDKIRAYNTQIASLGAQQQLREGIQLGLEVLRELGIFFPIKPRLRHVLVSLAKTRAMIGARSESEFLSSQRVRDRSLLAALQILSSMTTFALLVGESGLYTLMNLRMLQITLKHGLSNQAVHCFATWSTIQSLRGNKQKAYRFGQLSLQLCDGLNARNCEVRALMVIHCNVNHWTKPLRDSVEPLKRALDTGLSNGDALFGFLAAFAAGAMMMSSGYPLYEVNTYMGTLSKQMVEFGQEMPHLLAIMIRQVALNFQGESDDPLRLGGTAVEAEDTVRAAGKGLTLFTYTGALLILAGIFQDWQLADSLVQRVRSAQRTTMKTMRAHFSSLDLIFISAMTHIVQGKLRPARKLMRQVGKWVQNGKEDARPVLQMLDMEYLCASKADKIDASTIKAGFTTAAGTARARKYLHYQAFANERAATILKAKGERQDALEFLLEARGLYEIWGGYGKVKQIDKLIEEAE